MRYTFRNQTVSVLALAFAVTLAGCDVLSVLDPGAIEESQLTDPALEQTIVNGVRGEFQYTHSYASQWAGVLGDELLLHHTYFPTVPVVLRDLQPDNVYVGNVYSFWQRARQSADDAVGRLESILGAEADASLNMARVQAYRGYSYTLIGETFCEAPINLSRAYTDVELLELGLPAFDEAIRVAENARTGGADASEANRIINLANVGKARALLHLGRMSEAATHASRVTEGFEMWIPHSNNSTREHNPFFSPTTGQNNRYLSVGPRFANLNDMRIAHTDSILGLVSGSRYLVPQRAMNHEGWEAGQIVPFSEEVDIRFASYLEAQYIIAEAQGPTAATLDFVNSRREVGGQEPVNLSGDALLAELRDQRARDFYLSGHRLGDLRRYLRQDGLDLFPSGIDPYQNQPYGNSTCFPIPLAELNSNPNL
jgi:hypothetical protein